MNAWIRSRALQVPMACAAVLVFCAGLLHLRWPIFALDEDLWYHLAAGRYLVEHRALARDAFFSFIPDRPWENYYGLFQALVFGIFRGAGYPGLVAFRTLLFTGTAALALALVLRGDRTPLQRWWGLVFGALAIVVLSDRSRVLRPHAISYFSIAAFLVLLTFEAERRFTWLVLFAIGAVWVNSHGVEYPVLLAILGAFAVEAFREARVRGTPLSASDRRRLATCLVPMLSIFASPLGARLLPIPFTSIVFANHYIRELAPFVVSAAGDVRFDGFALSSEGAARLLILASAALVAISAWRRTPGLGPAILFVVGLALLSKGMRFTHEFALLSLPAIRASLPRGAEPSRTPSPLAAAGFALAAVLLPILAIRAQVTPWPAWPVSREGLPAGVSRFLERQPAGMRVLNMPNHGGYLEWALYGRDTILMNMDVPFLFSDDDYFVAMSWFNDPAVFEKVAAAHRPDFLAAPIAAPAFGQFAAAFPRYVPVFVDDVAVLYVDSAAHPEIAAAWGIRNADPFALAAIDPAAMSVADRRAIRDWLAKVRAVDPDIVSVDTLASRAALADGDPASALALGAEVVRNRPDAADGYVLQAEALTRDSPERAERLFRDALARAAPGRAGPIHARLRDLEERQGEFAAAYRDALAAVNGFPIDAGALELYKMAVAATRAGRVDDARRWLRFSWLRTTPRDVELRATISKLLGGAPSPGATPPPNP